MRAIYTKCLFCMLFLLQAQVVFCFSSEVGSPFKEQGELQILIFDKSDGTSETKYYLFSEALSERPFELTYGSILKLDANIIKNLRTGSAVELEGIFSEKETIDVRHLRLLNSDANISEFADINTNKNQVQGVTKNRQVAMIAISFSNLPSNVSLPTAKSTFSNTIANYKATSYGSLVFNSPDIYGPYKIVNTSGNCDTFMWKRNTNIMAANAGVDLSKYQHIIYLIPTSTTSCDWDGTAAFNCGDNCTMVSKAPYTSMVYTHEFGHNLGMNHASNSTSEYGDFSDPLGNNKAVSYLWFNGPHMDMMGWLTPFTDAVKSITAPGVYTLIPLSTNLTSTSGTQILKLSYKGLNYYLSYRQPTGFDRALSTTYTTGVSIHTFTGNGYDFTKYITTLKDNTSITPSAGLIIKQLTRPTDLSSVQVEITYPYTAPTDSASK